jgi:myo-inositol-1(or 4)-monophosphatase
LVGPESAIRANKDADVANNAAIVTFPEVAAPMHERPELTDLLETCVAAAYSGGEVLRAWRGRFQTREKAPSDLVTDADVASQRAIAEVIHAKYPDHHFLGEESSPTEPPPANVICWIVDPLDGTTNYVHGYPAYAVSVAATRNGEVLAGAILDPLSNLCYRAIRGGGAWKGDQRLRTSNQSGLSDALLAVSFPPGVTASSPDMKSFLRVAGRSRAIRRSGSCALNLAFLAEGVIDGFWAFHIHSWDVAAGVLLVREAGGIVTAVDGATFDLHEAHFAAAASHELHSELIALLTI